MFVAEIRRFLNFNITAVRHLRFLKVRNFNGRLVQFGGTVCVKLPNGQTETVAKIWPFFEMAAVRHVGFLKL